LKPKNKSYIYCSLEGGYAGKPAVMTAGITVKQLWQVSRTSRYTNITNQ
jgi:hypothetical protein